MFSRAVGREGGMLQTKNTGVGSQCLSHPGSAPAHGACSHPAHTARALGCSAGRGRSQDGGGVGRGENFLPHKLIKRAFKRPLNSTKQLLNAGRGHQAPRKATQLFERSATEQVSLKKKKVSSTIPFVSGRKPDTEETSKQKKI